jgi:YVTN family beta-propeller protein
MDDRQLLVTNQHADTLSVIDTGSLKVLHTIAAGGYPEGIAVYGERAYVVNWMDDNVSVIDMASYRTHATITTGKNSRGFGSFIGVP